MGIIQIKQDLYPSLPWTPSVALITKAEPGSINTKKKNQNRCFFYFLIFFFRFCWAREKLGLCLGCEIPWNPVFLKSWASWVTARAEFPPCRAFWGGGTAPAPLSPLPEHPEFGKISKREEDEALQGEGWEELKVKGKKKNKKNKVWVEERILRAPLGDAQEPQGGEGGRSCGWIFFFFSEVFPQQAPLFTCFFHVQTLGHTHRESKASEFSSGCAQESWK